MFAGRVFNFVWAAGLVVQTQVEEPESSVVEDNQVAHDSQQPPACLEMISWSFKFDQALI